MHSNAACICVKSEHACRLWKSGSVNNTVQDEYKTENTAPEKDTEKESVDSQENTMPALELLGTELDTLEDQVKSGNVEETATHLYAVEEAFGQMAEEAEEIIRSSDELSNLSDEAQSLLEKRKGNFRQNCRRGRKRQRI